MTSKTSSQNLVVKAITGRSKVEINFGDRAFVTLLRLIGIGVIIVFVALIIYLADASQLAISKFGFDFFISKEWNPVVHQYGALSFVYGTLVSSFLALLLAVPISVGTAVFLTELCPRPLRGPIGFLVEMLAAIPSVVYGLWGIFVLAPFVVKFLKPIFAPIHDALINVPFYHYFPIFEPGPPVGINMMISGIILAIMITPTITAVCREVFKAIPDLIREGALALGATRWEMIRVAVLKTGFAGIVGGVILGLGRALGETMAVTMVIGNKADISASLFAPGATMASVLANEYAEANYDLHLSSLVAVGLTLLFVSILVNSAAKVVIWKFGVKS